jgi:UDP-N-acetylmuramoyl-tripeptide--D-alanyl-D-alanine ligase
MRIMPTKKILWNTQSLTEALGFEVPHDLNITNVSIDSRTIKKGSLFVAIRGEKFNGNEFAADAIKNGAVACIVDELHESSKQLKGKLIQVEDTLETLRKLAAYARARVQGKIIGITGSVGKTSTKEMLKIAFEHQGNVYASEGNFNNHFGLPLCLANMPADTDFGIFEMGMTGRGEISNLSQLTKPNISIITTVEAVHLEFFTSVAGIAAAKSEIFDGMKQEEVAIINADNPYAQILIEKAKEKKLKVVTFAEENKANYRLLSYGIKDEFSYMTAECNGKDIDYKINALGKHLAFNSLAVLAAVKEAGAELEYAANNLRYFKAQKGRGAVIHVANRNVIIIDDSYNASPASIRAALDNLQFYKNDNHRVIIVLGNMVQLGPETELMHMDLSSYIEGHSVDKVYTVGNLMKKLFDKLPANLRGAHADSSAEMLEIISNDIKAGDVLLVKGSNAMKMNVIVENLID